MTEFEPASPTYGISCAGADFGMSWCRVPGQGEVRRREPGAAPRSSEALAAQRSSAGTAGRKRRYGDQGDGRISSGQTPT